MSVQWESSRMENILENKAKFFALYWGQNIQSYKLTYSWKRDVKVNGYASGYLTLKPLSTVTDEDAIEVLKIFGQYNSGYVYQFITKTNSWKETFRQVYTNDLYKDGGHQGIDAITVHCNFTDKGLHALHSNRDETYWRALDFLRSKGYVLPWMGLSVAEMVKSGWVKLKESKP